MFRKDPKSIEEWSPENVETCAARQKEIVENEGVDYRAYTLESKKAIAAAASMAVSVKAVLDTPLLADDGSLTDASEELCKKQMPAINHSAGQHHLPEDNQ